MGQGKSNHKYYVLGFVRDDQTGDVLFVRKTRPEFLKGLLNGVGGHVENIARDTEHSPYAIGRVPGYMQISPDYEYPVMSMLRECFEETGLFIPAHHWIELGTLGGPDHDFTVFLYGTSWDLKKAATRTSEEVLVLSYDEALLRQDLAPHVLDILKAM